MLNREMKTYLGVPLFLRHIPSLFHSSLGPVASVSPVGLGWVGGLLHLVIFIQSSPVLLLVNPPGPNRGFPTVYHSVYLVSALLRARPLVPSWISY